MRAKLTRGFYLILGNLGFSLFQTYQKHDAWSEKAKSIKTVVYEYLLLLNTYMHLLGCYELLLSKNGGNGCIYCAASNTITM